MTENKLVEALTDLQEKACYIHSEMGKMNWPGKASNYKWHKDRDFLLIGIQKAESELAAHKSAQGVTGPLPSVPQVPACACDAINSRNCPIHGNAQGGKGEFERWSEVDFRDGKYWPEIEKHIRACYAEIKRLEFENNTKAAMLTGTLNQMERLESELTRLKSQPNAEHAKWQGMESAEPGIELICLRVDGTVEDATFFSKPTRSPWAAFIGWMPKPSNPTAPSDSAKGETK